MKKVLSCILVLVMVLSMMAGCSNPGSAPAASQSSQQSAAASQSSKSQPTAAGKEPINLAFICPLTGNNGQYGQAYKNACTMLTEKINNNGGINGSQLNIDYFDDKNDPNEALLLAQKVVAAKKYCAVLGSQSSACSMVIAPVLQAAGIVELSPQTSHIDFTKTGDYIFRMLITVAYEGPAYADYIMKTWPKTRKPGILYFETDFGKGLTKYLAERFTQYGLNLMSESFVPDTTKDFTPMLSKLQSAGCDLLIPIGAYSDVAQLLIQKDQLGFDVPVFADGMIVNEAFRKIAGNAAEGLQVLDIIYMKSTEEPFASFKKDYEARYKVGVDMYACSAYDALSLIVKAIEKYGPVSAKIKDFLTNEVKGITGVTGSITFTADRVRNVNFVVEEYTKGDFVQIGNYTPDVNSVPTKVK